MSDKIAEKECLNGEDKTFSHLVLYTPKCQICLKLENICAQVFMKVEQSHGRVGQLVKKRDCPPKQGHLILMLLLVCGLNYLHDI